MAAKKVAEKEATMVYDKEVVNLLQEVSHMSPRMRLTKKGNAVIVSHSNVSATIVYRLAFAHKQFAFNGEQIGFYNFQEFAQLVSTLSTPEITHIDDVLNVREDSVKIKYVLAEPSSLPESPPEEAFSIATPLSFKLPEKDIRELRKMIGLIGAEQIRVKVNAKGATLTLCKNMKDHTFEKTWPIEQPTEIEWEFLTTTDIIEQIPNGDYVVGVAKTPATFMLKFSLNSAKVSLDIYTGELVDD